MDDSTYQFSQPFASTSRAVFTLPHRPRKLSKHEQEQAAELKRSHELYRRAWAETTQRIEAVLSTLHSSSLTSVTAFVDSTHTGEPSLLSALAARTPLPTGLVIGASPGSSTLLFAALTKQLTTSGRNVVARLSSRDCSTIKGALKAVVASFVGAVADEDDDGADEEDGTLNFASGPKSASLAPEDLQNLSAWYAHKFAKQQNRSTTASAKGPNLVVLLEDLEAFDGRVLSALIETLSAFVPSLPLVLLLGIATSADALYNAVTRPVTNLLDVVPFFCEPGVNAFCALIRGVFVEWDAPLALGPKAHAYLWQTFSEYDHSIDAAVSAIQLLYMTHFMNKPFAALTLPPQGEDGYDQDLLLDLPQVVKALPSVAYSLEAFPSGPVAHLSIASTEEEQEDALIDLVQLARGQKLAWRKRRQEAFEAFLVAREFWEKRLPMELALEHLVAGTLTNRSDEVAILTLHSSAEKLPKFLKALQDALLDPKTTLALTLAGLVKPLEQVLAAPKPNGRQNLINMNLPSAELTSGKNAQPVDRQYSQLAKQLSDLLKKTWREAFVPSTDLLAHEVWFANDAKQLRAFHPSAQTAFLRALEDADSSAAQAKGDEDVAVVAPDVAVAFKLYRDSGRLINLADWWKAFEQSAAEEIESGQKGGPPLGEEEEKKEKGREKKRERMQVDGEEEEQEEEEEDGEDGEEDDAEEDTARRRKQARFLRAVADLSHAGYVQPTSRKVEHVAKTIF